MGDQKNRQRAQSERVDAVLRVSVDPETITPLGEAVLIELLSDTRTEAGLILPESAKLTNRARVRRVGPGHLCESGERVGVGVKPGDLVILGPGAPMVAVGSTPSGNALTIVGEGHILAIDSGTHDGVVRVGLVQ